MTAAVSDHLFDRLIASLRTDGLSDEADRLYEMIYKTAWTTGSELNGELGLILKRIDKERRRAFSEESKRIMREARKTVRKLNRGW